MVIEALVVLGVITIATVNAPIENKAPQEIKSVSTTIDANKVVKPKVKPKKKKGVKKVDQKETIKQQPPQELVKKETAKSEPTKAEPSVTVSSPEQKSNQSNLLYYILGFLTLGATAAYFYFRKKSQTADSKIYTSDELKQSLQQDADKFKYTPPDPQVTAAEPQQPSSSDQTSSDPKPNPEDEVKKS